MDGIEDQLAALVEGALAAPLGSAAAVAVGDAGTEVVRVVRGHACRVPDLGPAVDATAWFDVASLTKPMVTAACAMVLVGEGRLELDAPVRRWFGDAATRGTIGELLGHAAGCTAHVEYFRDLHAHPPSDPRAELTRRAIAEPADAPGRAARYSDLGYLILGAILERVVDAPLEDAYRDLVAEPLGLVARYPAGVALPGAVATELDAVDPSLDPASAVRGLGRGLVMGRVHDENAYVAGGVCGHAGLFATIDDVSRFAAAIVGAAAGHPRGRLRPEVVDRFVTTAAAPGASWRLGWDTPSVTPEVSHAGDRWPRVGGVGHLGFTGTSLWLDLPRRRWVVLLTNRVHPTREGSADAIKALRRAIGDLIAAA